MFITVCLQTWSVSANEVLDLVKNSRMHYNIVIVCLLVFLGFRIYENVHLEGMCISALQHNQLINKK